MLTSDIVVHWGVLSLFLVVVLHRYLFNLATDPTESHDLSKAEPDMFAKMHAALEAWVSASHSNTVNLTLLLDQPVFVRPLFCFVI